MKIYTLTIVYDDRTEDIEYISEEIEGDTEVILEVDLQDSLDKDDLEFIKGCTIIGKA